MMVQYLLMSPPPVRFDEVLRYSGVRHADERMMALARECVEEALPHLQYAVCFAHFPVTVDGDTVRFAATTVRCASLAEHLCGCEEAVLFAATVGIGMDRLIAKYQAVSPSKAVVMQAIGAERIESLCDAFCDELGDGITDRFSPGYGDLPLTFQKEMFALLDCSRKIGLTLNDSLLMSPSKSVTAIVGVGGYRCGHRRGCASCDNVTCEFRRI